MSNRRLWHLLAPCSLAIAATLHAGDVPPFRTDANPDKSLKWYELIEGKFPPADSAHAISGELIQCDHPERRFQLRVDRDDSQQVSLYDLPLEAAMLPLGLRTRCGRVTPGHPTDQDGPTTVLPRSRRHPHSSGQFSGAGSPPKFRTATNLSEKVGAGIVLKKKSTIAKIAPSTRPT